MFFMPISHIMCSGLPSFVTTWNRMVPFCSSSLAELSRDWNFVEGACDHHHRDALRQGTQGSQGSQETQHRGRWTRATVAYQIQSGLVFVVAAETSFCPPEFLRRFPGESSIMDAPSRLTASCKGTKQDSAHRFFIIHDVRRTVIVV
jgi:hypothetical protein